MHVSRHFIRLFLVSMLVFGVGATGLAHAQDATAPNPVSAPQQQYDQQAAQQSTSDAEARSTIAGQISTNLNAEWLAPTIRQIAVSSQTFAQQAFTEFAAPVGRIVSMLFAIWIIVQAAKMFLGRTGIGDFGWAMTTRSGALMLVLCLLSVGSYSGTTFWDDIIIKPVQETASISNAMLNLSGYSANCSSSDFASLVGCLETNVDGQIKQGVAAGLMLAFVPDWPGLYHIGALGIRIMSLLAGLLVAVIYGIALFYFAFFILDLIFEVCLITAMAPFFIGAFLLSYTRPWAVACLNRLLGAFLSIISASLAVAIVSRVMNNAAVPAGQEAGLSGVTTWQEFVQQAGSVHVQATQWLLNPTDAGYLMLLFSGAAMIPMTKLARNMFGSMIGAHNGEGVGSALGGKAAAFAAGVVTTAATASMPWAAAARAAGGVANAGAGAAAGAARSGYRMGGMIRTTRGVSGVGLSPQGQQPRPGEGRIGHRGRDAPFT